MDAPHQASTRRRYALCALRIVGWSTALLFAVVLAFIGRTLIIHLLHYAGVGGHQELATVAVSALVAFLFLRYTGVSRKAIAGAGLLMLAAFGWMITEVAVAIYGTQPPLALNLGPFAPETQGEWITLLTQLEMAWWTLLFGAGLVLLALAQGRKRRRTQGRGLSPASPSAKLERRAGA